MHVLHVVNSDRQTHSKNGETAFRVNAFFIPDMTTLAAVRSGRSDLLAFSAVYTQRQKGV